ncbi:hypothetical protein QN277_021537 [Acacia crassicarpa]|uniref:Carbohydrate kinase PfkB domain-containing protein n=1 Tax=Acacia crassicarpa TaxID=499986 RepID=A0AAE1MPI6_9FABA|nr:hypothetical protein QN277_021537 [Acacia crassicarpa]
MEKRAVMPSCWIRQTPTEMRPMRTGVVAAVAAACGIGGTEPGARRVLVGSRGLWDLVSVCDSLLHMNLDESKGVSGTPSNNGSFGDVDVVTINGRRRRQDSDKKYWEAGGNCNVAIAASRLGLDCFAIGHLGNEVYGKFLLGVLNDEGIRMVQMSDNADAANNSIASNETLLCWVLVDPLQRHGFCSRADFSKEPAFHWMKQLSTEVKVAIKKSKVLFCNGYGFDDLSPELLLSAVECAVEAGTAVFFDPGPRGRSLSTGTPEEQRAFYHFLRMSDVLLLTSDEAESLTGIGNPILAGQELLKRGIRTKWVIVKIGPRGSILISKSSIACAPAFKANVIDTVGCGDSFVAPIAYGFMNKMPLVNTLAIANAVGAATAMGCGAGRNVATLDKVTDIMRSSNLNVDNEFWTDLLEKNVDAHEIEFLSNDVVIGKRNQLKHVSFNKVASDLLPRFKFPQLEEKVLS